MNHEAFMTDTSQGNPGDNIDEGALTKRAFMARVTALGKAEGLGDNSRPGLFLATVEAAAKRVIGADDVEDVFDKYSKQVAMTQGVGWKPQASAKQQVSKLRVGVRLGELTHVNGLEVCNKVVAYQREQRLKNDGKLDYSPFDGLVKVAREQVKLPDAMLPDEVIGALLMKPGADIPAEADRVEAIVKAIEKLIDAKEEPVTAETKDALAEAAAPLMTRIKELGGSTSMRKQQAKLDKQVKDTTQALTDLVEARRIRALLPAIVTPEVYGPELQAAE